MNTKNLFHSLLSAYIEKSYLITFNNSYNNNSNNNNERNNPALAWSFIIYKIPLLFQPLLFLAPTSTLWGSQEK